MPQYRNPDGGLGSANFASRVRRSQESTIKSAKKTTSLNDFLIPSVLGLGTGLRTSAQLLAGFEADRVAKFNISQLENEISQLGVSTELKLSQFARQAVKLEGQQRTAVATSGFAFSGSVVDVMMDTQIQLELQRLDIQRQSDLQRQALQSQQTLTARKAKSAKTASYIGAGVEAATGIAGLLRSF